MPTRVPRPEDFDDLSSSLRVSLVFPEVPETTTAILVLFHGLGDSEAPFAAFARGLNLPGVLAISVRGVSPLPPSLLEDLPESGGGGGGGGGGGPTRHFHWGDDLTLSPAAGAGGLDPDPGFSGAERLVLGRLVRETLLGRCGWDARDILLLGFGQGGSLALGLASRLRGGGGGGRVVDVAAREEEGDRRADERSLTAFKGAVSIGGPLPASMIPTAGAREKARTPVLLCRGRSSELLDDEAVGVVRGEFRDVRDVRWGRDGDGMPRNRGEMFPVMQFFAERLGGGR